MKRFLSSAAAIATAFVLMVSAGAEEPTPGASSGETNPSTGMILTLVPTGLAAVSLLGAGIAVKRKNKK